MVIANKKISGWGNYPIAECRVLRPERMNQIDVSNESVIARGLGRSYGDASLNSQGEVIMMERLNCFQDFDETTGVLRADAGVTIEEMIDVFLPRGWFPAVTPGTKSVTLGGCFACDVHGKNHHQDGSFADHVIDIELLTADGRKQRLTQSDDLFWATAGGMGLTGIITEVIVKLIPVQTSYLIVQHQSTKNFEDTVDKIDQSQDDKYSVAWIDCLATGDQFGRGVMMTGDHAQVSEITQTYNPLSVHHPLHLSLPCHLPNFFLNRWTIKAFNQLYYKLQGRKQKPFLIDYDRFFYPLDRIKNWNRLYGRRGFLQYQCVLKDKKDIKNVLKKITEQQRASFLAVLKRFGPGNKGYLSFPIEGYTLALDFPMSVKNLFPFLDELDAMVLEAGGRVYLAKDAHLKPETFRAMYPKYKEWVSIKKNVDSHDLFKSDLSRRLEIGK